MKSNEFIEKYFSPGSRPDLRTIRASVRRGEIRGRIVLGRVFIDVDHWERSTGNALADDILERLADAGV